MDKQQEDRLAKAITLSFIVCVCIVLTIVVNVYGHNQTLYTHLYYVPLLVAAIWYHRKALALAIFFGLLHISANYLAVGYWDSSMYATFLRSCTFFFVTGLASWVAEQKDDLYGRLKQSHTELANIIELYPDATLIIDTGGKVVAWNRAMEAMTGVKAADMIGKGDMEYAVPFYGKRVPILIDLIGKPEGEIRAAYSDVTVAGGRLEAVATQARIAGNDRPVLHGTASKLYDSGGRMIGAIESIRDITAQKRLEMELAAKLKELEYQHIELEQQDGELLRVLNLLKESEEKYRVIAEYINDGIFVLDPRHNFSFFNRRAEEITGYKGEEVVGRHLQDILGPEHAPAVCRALEQIEQGHLAPSYEAVLPRKDGRPVPAELSVGTLRDATGKPGGLVVAFRDITLRKQAEDILKRYQMLSQYANDIILFIRSDGRIIEANDTALLAYGYRRAELLDMRIGDLRASDPPELVRKQMDQADREGIVFETVHRCKDGRLLPVEVSSRGVNMGQERVLLSIVRDISERKRAQQLQRESEERYRMLVENAPLGIFTCDLQGNITSINPKVLELVGSQSPDFTRSVNLLSFEPLVKSGLIFGLYDRLIKGESVVAEGSYTSYWGKSIYMRFHLTPLRDYADKIIGTLGIIEDITDRKRAEDALQASEARFRNIFEDSAVGIYLVDAGGRILDSNDAIRQMLGYGGAELRKLTVREVTYPDDYDEDSRRYREMLEGACDSYHLEKRYVRADGSVMWGRLFVSIVRDPAGQPLYCISMVEDFTERRVSEEALRYKNQELGIISDIAAIINRSNSLEEVLEGTLTGSLELLGMDAGAIYLADPADRSRLTLRAFVPRTGAGLDVEPRKAVRADASLNAGRVFHTADGGAPLFREIFVDREATVIVPILLKGFAIGLMAFCSDGQPERQSELPDLLSIGSQLGVAIDNHTLLRTLRATSNYMAGIINESPDAILTADAQGTIISSNKRVARLLQYDMAELPGMNVRQLLPPDGADLTLSEDRSYVRDFMRKDGSSITLNISTSRFESGDVPGGFIITLKDLSEISGLKIVPIVENAVDGARKYQFGKGLIYLLDKGRHGDGMDVFADQVKHNIQGLCITRHSPKKVREQYGLQKTPIVWLNGSDLPTDEHCIKPDNLTGLGATIYKFLAEAKDGIVIIEGVEYLVARNSFESLLKFLHLLNDRVMISNCSLLLCLDPLSLDTRQYHLLRTELQEFGENEGP